MSSVEERPQAPPGSPTPEFLQLVPHAYARQHLVCSGGQEGGRELLLHSSSTPPIILHNVGVRLGRPCDTNALESDALAELIDAVYGQASAQRSLEEDFGTLEDDMDALLAASDSDLLQTQGKGRLVRLVDTMLFEALQRGASDVHIQPIVDRTLVRYRVDGALYTARTLAPKVTAAVISRIKVMAQMDIAERRVAQDGRAVVRIGERKIDLRVSTFPTSYGERTVLRLLDQTNQLADLASIGMPARLEELFLESARRSNGLIFVTGPTGSGKTTTLYSTLSRIAAEDVNIMTVEDPIEYELSTAGLAISQAQVNLRKGVTFASGLRHVLRQDPDVVLVGEVRDEETARLAIQASLTGHMVLSTLHTNDAASAVTRLLDLGIEPFLLGSSLTAILAQRLVRRTHQECKGRGCASCYETGFAGRIGIFEIIVVDEAIRSLIVRGGRVSSIREAARSQGLSTLREEGERLVRHGLTTLLEVERVVQAAR